MPQERKGSWLLTWLSRTVGLGFCYTFFIVVLPFYFLSGRVARKGIMEFYRHLGVTSSIKGLTLSFRNYKWFVLSMLDKVARAHGKVIQVTRKIAPSSFDTEARGAILVGAHFGDWSFCGAAFSQKKSKVAVVLNPHQSSQFQQSVRGHSGLEIIDASRPGIEILLDVKRVLEEKGFVCFLGDRKGPETRVGTCEFLGEEAVFPIAPFELALRLKVALFDFYCVRSGKGRHAVYELSVNEIWLPSGEAPQQTASDLLRIYVKRLESYVREAPYQWFNFFDFWAR